MNTYKGIHRMFSEAALKFAGDPAIEWAGGRMSFDDVEKSANRLANFLLTSGAAKEDRVGIFAEGPARIVVAILGILKAGCAYVPFDRRFPMRRTEHMVRLASPAWMLAESELLGDAGAALDAAGSDARLFSLDDGPPPEAVAANPRYLGRYRACEDESDPLVERDPDGLCYIYFTSGSTGTPKAIAGRLKSISHFIDWEIETLGLKAGVRVSQLTAPTFDAFLRDVFVPLCCGGTVCIPVSPDAMFQSRSLADWLDIEQINVVHCVPSVFRGILSQNLDPACFGALRYVLLAGEPLFPSDVKRWTDVYRDRVQLVNLYGPTETTMTKLFYFVSPSDTGRASIPIGKAMKGAAVIVLDAKGKPCPPGIIGEIHIRTPFRSLGYYQQPELTARSFVTNPFSTDPEDLIYKTGDLGRLLEDGNIEYVGRRDQQVKVRGVRLEMVEIENCLMEHPEVVEAAVSAREDGSGTNYLCAYVVSSGEVEPDQLRSHLNGLLPEHAIPSVFVRMERLPRTLNGKIDRLALPSPEEARKRAGLDYIAPRNPAEEQLAEIWAEVLGLKNVGVNDNFFDLGGHSLNVLQVVSRMQSAFDIELPLATLFKAPTISRLADYIETVRWALDGPESPSAEQREEIAI
ncbi:MAG TPA: non-ribosomal peptide synthetase [Blastocatellia bacterium]